MLDKTEVLFLLLRINICVTRIKIQERSLNTILRYNLHCGLMRSFLFTLTVKNETLAVHITGTLLASKFVMTRLNLPGYDTSAPQVTILLPLRDTWFTTGYPPPLTTTSHHHLRTENSMKKMYTDVGVTVLSYKVLIYLTLQPFSSLLPPWPPDQLSVLQSVFGGEQSETALKCCTILVN